MSRMGVVVRWYFQEAASDRTKKLDPCPLLWFIVILDWSDDEFYFELP